LFKTFCEYCFIRKYPDKWIAIFEKCVVAVGDSIRKVEREAVEKTSQDPKRIAIMFVERGGYVY
jgi:DNA repair photolyase